MVTANASHNWSLADAVETYGVHTWGAPFFGVNEKGHVCVHPDGPTGASIDMKELVDEVRRRGISLPLLLRFTDVLRKRVVLLNEAFRKAIAEYNYRGTYQGVYPIKVNQHRHVVETIVETGRQYGYGLEAGSKPELLAVMALLDHGDSLVICNGYKDEEYVETALRFSQLGRKVILVVEKPSELSLIAQVSARTGILPSIGMRVKLSSRGAGRWEASGGDNSKFGLSSGELLEAIAFMRKSNLLQCFELMHFHLGSQISNIRSVKNAMREVSRFFVEVAKLGAPLNYVDVGGGLGVDYAGSRSDFSSSMNYTTEAYANDVVFSVMEACDAEGVAHPVLISESGRAVVAHHAVLVMDVLGANEPESAQSPEQLPPNMPSVVQNLYVTYKEVTNKNLLESYHDAQGFREESLSLFSHGLLKIEERVITENVFWSLCRKIMRIARAQGEIPEELEALENQLTDTYFCNFSVFRSLPDYWAIEQLFPVMPIHRLHEKPTRRAVLADITCDAVGKVDRFIDKREEKDFLELHPLNDDDYYLGVFLVGAYQEILGVMHNLFGDTHVVQVSQGAAGGYQIDHVVEGDTVLEALHYMSYRKDDLVASVRRHTEVALRKGRISLDESRNLLRMYEEGLAGYTYLERDVDATFMAPSQLRLTSLEVATASKT